MVLDERLIYEILSVVEEIPRGRVATYGQIAGLIGRDRNARLVGKVLSMAEYYGNYPCHRVVNHAGRLAPSFHEQRLPAAALARWKKTASAWRLSEFLSMRCITCSMVRVVVWQRVPLPENSLVP